MDQSELSDLPAGCWRTKNSISEKLEATGKLNFSVPVAIPADGDFYWVHNRRILATSRRIQIQSQ